MNKLFFVLLLCSFSALANLSQSFPAGRGAKYKVKIQNNSTPIHLSLYVAGTKVDSVNIEYFMETQGIVPVQMWQQFEIGVNSKKNADIRRGYLQTKELKTPEIIPDDYLKGAAGGIQVNDFLFAEKSELDKMKIGEEMVEVSAGATKATHYRTTNNGQTVDFWISDEARPMGLVMLVSKSSKNPNQNYSLELINLIDNIKAKIIPEEAVKLSDKGKSFLTKPERIK